MADQRKDGIAWTDETWNPLRGCSRVSEGCRNCYAESVAGRFSGPGQPFEGLAKRVDGQGRWTGVIRLIEKKLSDPLRWKRPRRVFVNSMSDLFHETVTDDTLDQIFAVMALSRQHSFQVLTKRPQRMRAYLSDKMTPHRIARWCVDLWIARVVDAPVMGDAWPVLSIGDSDLPDDITMTQWPLHNVWLGVSVEDQDAADGRIPHLLATPAAVRFLSCEPLLGPVDLTDIRQDLGNGLFGDALQAYHIPYCDRHRLYPRIDWVIAGGESGPNARPMHPDWVRSLRDQCAAATVSFFFKQWGGWAPVEFVHELEGHQFREMEEWVEPTAGMYRVGKKTAGHLLDGVAHRDIPEG